MTFQPIPAIFRAVDCENSFLSCMLGIHKASASMNYIFNIFVLLKAFWRILVKWIMKEFSENWDNGFSHIRTISAHKITFYVF